MLAKQGITNDAKVNELVEQNEEACEEKIKVREAEKLLRQLMEQKRTMTGTGRLMQRGNKRWKTTIYRPIGGE